MASARKSPTAERVVLRGVSWKTYECLLQDVEERSSPRIAYSGGLLEIMTASLIHENWNRDLANMIRIMAKEWRINVMEAGSTTLKRPDREGGLEPDSSFSIQNVERLFGSTRIDLEAGDAVPDLVIETDIPNSSLLKLPLFATFGVPELWRIDASGAIQFFVFGVEVNSLATENRALPLLTTEAANPLLNHRANLLSLDWEDRVHGGPPITMRRSRAPELSAPPGRETPPLRSAAGPLRAMRGGKDALRRLG